MIVVHVAKEPTLQKAFEKETYHFYDYKPFVEENNIEGLYMRLSYFVQNVKADLVIFDFDRPDLINDMELGGMNMVVPSINIRPALSSAFLSKAATAYVELKEYSEVEKTPRKIKKILKPIESMKTTAKNGYETLGELLGIKT